MTMLSIHLNRQENGIAILTINRPDVLNALDRPAMQQFADAIHVLSQDETLRVLILVGAGTEAFCSGADLEDVQHVTTPEAAKALSTVMGDALLKMERLPVPVIAAINGYALGGGSEIALACDMRIVDAKVRFGFVQVRLAVTPAWGAGQRLLRLIGYSRAMEVLLRGHVMRAHEIEALDLAYKVVAPGQALEHALKLANQIIEAPLQTTHGIKTILQAGVQHSYEDALQIARETFTQLWSSEAHQDAVEESLRRQERSNNAS